MDLPKDVTLYQKILGERTLPGTLFSLRPEFLLEMGVFLLPVVCDALSHPERPLLRCARPVLPPYAPNNFLDLPAIPAAPDTP